MKVRGGLVAVIVLAVIALVWWMRAPSTSDDVRSDEGLAAGSDRTGPRAKKQLAASNLSGKRVAGTVTLDGAPVGGAVVSIHRDGQPDQRTTSDATGRFDLGTHEAGSYAVVAEKPGLTTEYRVVDLRRPEPSDQLRIALHGCDAAIHGTVRDASGGPVANARIARGVGDKGVEADAEGHYTLCVPLGDSYVAVDADGYARLDESVTAYGRVRRDFELVPEAIVVGRVVRADDKHPVGGARITITMSTDPTSRSRNGTTTVIADDDGQFRADGLLPGRYVVHATADGLASRDGVAVIAEVGSLEPLTCEVSSSMTVTGKVIDRESKQGVAAISVVLRRIDESGESVSAVSDADGTFALEHLFSGRHRVWAEQYRVTEEALAIEETTRNIVIEIEVGGSISGRVTYRGQGVDNTYVSSRTSFGGDMTDSDGRFEIRGLPAGDHRLYAESSRLGAFTRDRVVTIAKGERRTGVEVELDLEGSIEGIVVDQDGKPVSGVALELSLLRGSDFGQATTSEDGTFKARNLSGGGDYGYLVRSLDGSLKFPPLAGKRFSPIRVDNGQTHVTGVRIAIRYERLTIAGRVQTTRGKPLPDVTVGTSGDGRAPAASSRTAIDGTFTLRDLPAGDYTVFAMAPRGRGHKTAVRAGRRDVVISIPEPGAITGTVENFSGAVTVLATSNDSELRTSTSNGSFSFTGIPPGTYLLVASTTAGDRVSLEVTLTDGATLVAPPLRARGVGSVVAIVVDEAGKPMAGVECAMTGSYGHRSDAHGVARIPKISAGKSLIWCNANDRPLGDSQQVEVVANQTTEVRLTLKTWETPPTATGGFEADTKLDEFVITSIVPGGPAERAGIAVGDVVVNYGEVARAMYRAVPGTIIKLIIERDDKQRTVMLTLEKP